MKNTKGSSIEYRSNIAKRKKHGLQEQPELMQVKLTLHIQNNVASGSSNDPVNDPINDPINLTERQKMILRMFLEEKKSKQRKAL